MFRCSIILLLLWGVTGALFGQGNALKYHKSEARQGDGVYSLLRRYALDKYSCNVEAFYKLNKMKKNASLKTGKIYNLPILLYKFDGKTIRSSVGIDDWDRALSIQKYNEAMLVEHLRKESFKTDRILWVPYHQLNCPEEELESLPPVFANPEEDKAGDRIFPIFGAPYSYTPLESSRLKGKVFYISSGHGGVDPGAMATRGGHTICEDEYAYDVSLRLCRQLIAHGATTYMVVRDEDDGIRSGEYLECDKDEKLWGGVRMVWQQKARLFQRSNIINELYEKHRQQGVTDQLLVEIHVDSRSRSERTDVFFYHHSSSDEGKELAEQMHQTLKAKYKQYRAGGYYHGTVSSRDLHMLRESKPNSVYVELANIRNFSDQARIVLESNRQLLANWLFEGITK